MVRAEEQFWGSIPPCGHIFGEDVGLEVLEKRAGKSEVADLEVAVGVD